MDFDYYIIFPQRLRHPLDGKLIQSKTQIAKGDILDLPGHGEYEVKSIVRTFHDNALVEAEPPSLNLGER